MPDPVPDGYERFGVSLTLRAAAADGLAYSADSFILTGESMEPTGPVRFGGGPGEIPDGMQASLTLIFQAPEDATSLRLSFRGASQAVLLEDAPQDEGDEGDHGH